MIKVTLEFEDLESLASWSAEQADLNPSTPYSVYDSPETPTENPPVSNKGPQTPSDGSPSEIPWDDRIHASSGAKTADGQWRYRRKPKDIDKNQWLEYINTVESELRNGAPATPVPETEPLFPEVPEPPMPEPTPPAPELTFADYAAAVTKAGIHSNTAVAACTTLGLTGPADLIEKPEFIPQVMNLLGVSCD